MGLDFPRRFFPTSACACEKSVWLARLLTGDGERHQAARFLSVVVRDVSLERRLTSLSVSFLRHCQALKTPPLKSTMHGDDWIVQTDLLAIYVGHVVRVVALYEAFAQEAD